jgi:outer membrane receptor protein involved in Fe transport
MKIYRADKLLSCAASMTIAVASFGAPAYSQTVSASDTAQASSTDDADIIVTASRTATAASKVPISITAFTNKQLEEQGIRNFRDVIRFTPGLQLNESAFGSNDIAIRGIRSGAGAPTTGVYIDDVPIMQRAATGAGAIYPAVFDLERVEVLRGPQGTLFGAGSQGGTIRFIRAQPGLTDYSGLFRAEGAIMPNHDGSYEIGGAIGGPLIRDKIGFRVSAYHRRDGGWIDKAEADFEINPLFNNPNILPGTAAGQDISEWNAHRGNFGPTSMVARNQRVTEEDSNWRTTTTFTGALTFAPVETIKITPSFFYQKERIGNAQTALWQSMSDLKNNRYVVPDFSPGPAGSFTPAAIRQAGDLIPGVQLTQLDLEDTERGGATMKLADLNISWDVGAATIYSTTAFLEQDRFQFIDYTNGYQTAYSQQVAAVRGSRYNSLVSLSQRSFSQEVRLQSNSDGPLKWVVGGFYQNNRQVQDFKIEGNTWVNANNFFGVGRGAASVLPPALANVTLGTNPFGPGALYSQNIWGDRVLGNSTVYQGNPSTGERQLSGFGQVDWKVTEQITLIAGVRYLRTWLDYTQFLAGPENNLNAPYLASCRKPDGTAGVAGVDCVLGQPGFRAADYARGTVSSAENAFTPKLGINFQVDDRNLVYASASKGYRPGGGQLPLPAACNSDLILLGYVDAQGRAQTPTVYGSDNVWAYELGTKNRGLFGAPVNFAGSAFYIKWKNIQSSLAVPTCGYSFIDNLASATVMGFDFEFDAQPFEVLRLAVSGGYTQLRLDDAVLSPAGGIVLPANAPLAGSGPSWRVVFSADYVQQISETTELYGRTDVTWTSSTPPAGVQIPGVLNFNPNSLPDAANTLVNARIGVRMKDIDLSVFVNNVLNQNGLISNGAARNRAFWTGTINRPRQIGATASYRF